MDKIRFDLVGLKKIWIRLDKGLLNLIGVLYGLGLKVQPDLFLLLEIIIVPIDQFITIKSLFIIIKL